MNNDDQRMEAASTQAEDVFFDALGYEHEAEQKAFVEKACQGNEALSREVDALFKSLSELDGFLEDGSSLCMTAKDLYDILSRLP